jgi:hypothetical protein
MKKFASSFIITLFIGLNCFGINPNSNHENHKLLDSVIVYNFSGVDSVKYEKLEYFYNDEGDNTFIFKYLWDSLSNDWSLYAKKDIQ